MVTTPPDSAKVMLLPFFSLNVSLASKVLLAESSPLVSISTVLNELVVVPLGTPHVPSPFKNFTLSDAVGALTKPAVPALEPSAPV